MVLLPTNALAAETSIVELKTRAREYQDIAQKLGHDMKIPSEIRRLHLLHGYEFKEIADALAVEYCRIYEQLDKIASKERSVTLRQVLRILDGYNISGDDNNLAAKHNPN